MKAPHESSQFPSNQAQILSAFRDARKFSHGEGYLKLFVTGTNLLWTENKADNL
jgi:hypothetical protein